MKEKTVEELLKETLILLATGKTADRIQAMVNIENVLNQLQEGYTKITWNPNKTEFKIGG